MTVPTFADDALAGLGEYALLFHIGGMPWAACTHQGVVDDLANLGDSDSLAYRGYLFGTFTGGGSYKTAQNVGVVATLDMNSIGRQSIKYHESKGIDVGGFSVKLARNPSLSYSYRPNDATPMGQYAGLDFIEDPYQDASIASATLYENSEFSDSTFKWFAEDSELYDLCVTNNAASVPTYIWCGSTCRALHGAPTDVGAGVYSSASTGEIFRSSRETLFKTTFDSSNLRVQNAPPSIAGMPGNLWLIPMKDGHILDFDNASTGTIKKPILIRTGPVANNTRGSADEWNISCKGWTDWLNQDIPTESITGKLKGYRFSRQTTFGTSDPGNRDGAQCPHFAIHEWQSSAYGWKEFWLCPAGDSVTFETFTDLAEAVQGAISDATAAATLYHDYTVMEQGDPDHFGSTLMVNNQTSAKYSYITGPVAWAMNMGTPNALGAGGIDGWSADFQRGVGKWQIGGFGTGTGPLPSVNEAYRHMVDGNPNDDMRWIPGKINATAYAKVPDPAAFVPIPINTRCEYFYQWNWEIDDAVTRGWSYSIPDSPSGNWIRRMPLYDTDGGLGEGFPLSYDKNNTDYRVTLADSADATTLSDETPISIGNGYRKNDVVFTEGHFKQEIEGTPADNYFYINVAGTNTWDSGGTYPLLRVDPSSPGPVPEFAERAPVWGMDLYYAPAVHGTSDPWAVTQATVIESNNIKQLFRGVLNATTDAANIPERHRLTNVPDAWSSSVNNWREMIDWTRLGTLAQSVYPDATFSIKLPQADGNGATSQNFWKLFSSALLSLGIRPTWEYCEEWRCWRMSFELLGVVSPLAAQQEGRIVSSTGDFATIKGEHPSETRGGTWLYHNVEYKFNYNGNEPGKVIRIDNKTGRAMAAGGRADQKTLTIEDRLLTIDADANLSAIIARLTSLLSFVNDAKPLVNFRCSPAAMARLGCAVDVSLTSDFLADAYTGTMGISSLGGMVTSLNIGLDSIGVSVRLSNNSALGISPSMEVAAARLNRTGDTVTITGLDTDPVDNDFADPDGLFTDLATFGCIVGGQYTNDIEVGACDCGAYAITVLDADATAYATTGASTNVWTGTLKGRSTATLTVDDVENGRCQLVLDAEEGYFDDATDKIVIFADRDNAGLQACQLAYGWLGDDAGSVEDSDGDVHRAMGWI